MTENREGKKQKENYKTNIRAITAFIKRRHKTGNGWWLHFGQFAFRTNFKPSTQNILNIYIYTRRRALIRSLARSFLWFNKYQQIKFHCYFLYFCRSTSLSCYGCIIIIIITCLLRFWETIIEFYFRDSNMMIVNAMRYRNTPCLHRIFMKIAQWI